jgi:hypothetical protein
LGIDAAKSTPALEAQVRGWLDHEGWGRVKRQVNMVRMWGYQRPPNWPVQDVPDSPAADAGPIPDSDSDSNGGDDDAPF